MSGRKVIAKVAGVPMRATSYVLILWLSVTGLSGFADSVMMIRAAGQHSIGFSGPVSPASMDPNKAPSEFNHHIAGWALIGVGFLVVASLLFPDLSALRCAWPTLFLLAGLFLALWSDAEIWPRGNLNWAWLLPTRKPALYPLPTLISVPTPGNPGPLPHASDPMPGPMPTTQ